MPKHELHEDKDAMLRFQAEDMVRGAMMESPQYKGAVDKAMGMLRGMRKEVQGEMKGKTMPKKKKGHKMPDGSVMAGQTHRAPPPVAK